MPNCTICHGDKESEAKGRLLSFDTGALKALGKRDMIIAHEFCMNRRDRIDCDWCGRAIAPDNIWIGPEEATICEECYATGGKKDGQEQSSEAEPEQERADSDNPRAG